MTTISTGSVSSADPRAAGIAGRIIYAAQSDDNIHTGMSRYIPNIHYASSQEEHDGRNDARETYVKPIMYTVLGMVNGEKRIVGLGEADGKTSTISIAETFPDAILYAVEPDKDYFLDLQFNVRNHPNIKPCREDMFNYKPENPNSVDVVYSLGALTDITPDDSKLTNFLRDVRENWLTSGLGTFILEEEIPPFYPIDKLHGREKGLAVQRGHQIFNAMLRGLETSRGLVDDELMALFSSLIPDKFGDYKRRLVDFEKIFKEAGYSQFLWIKVFPLSSDTYVYFPEDELVIDKDYLLPKGKKHKAVEIYNFAIGRLLNIDTDAPEPRNDRNYVMALDALLGLYDRVRTFDGAANRNELLEKNLGIKIVQGQTLLQGDTTADRTGGVYVLVAKV